MSEEKEKNTKIEDEATDAVDINVALVIAERDHYKEQCMEKDELIEELTKKLGQATDLIEEDSKAALVNQIAPKTMVDKSILSKMSIEKLMEWKKVLDVAQVPAFKAGTPFSYDKKPSARAKLDSKFTDYMAKIRGDS